MRGPQARRTFGGRLSKTRISDLEELRAAHKAVMAKLRTAIAKAGETCADPDKLQDDAVWLCELWAKDDALRSARPQDSVWALVAAQHDIKTWIIEVYTLAFRRTLGDHMKSSTTLFAIKERSSLS